MKLRHYRREKGEYFYSGSYRTVRTNIDLYTTSIETLSLYSTNEEPLDGNSGGDEAIISKAGDTSTSSTSGRSRHFSIPITLIGKGVMSDTPIEGSMIVIDHKWVELEVGTIANVMRQGAKDKLASKKDKIDKFNLS